jgi:hypothetical protein
VAVWGLIQGFQISSSFYISLWKFNILQKILFQNNHRYFSLVSSSQSSAALKFVSRKSLLRNYFIYIWIFNHFFLFSFLLCIFHCSAGQWDCYFGTTEYKSVTCTLYRIKFWRHVKVTSSNQVARLILFKYTFALQVDNKGPSSMTKLFSGSLLSTNIKPTLILWRQN